MPVALTDRIGRSPDKQLLRGRIGVVHSCVLDLAEGSSLHEGKRILEKLPTVIFVFFPGATWKLPSVDEPG